MALQVTAQDAMTPLNEAKSAYQSGNLDDTRFALQQALSAIDQAVGKDILELLPPSMSGMDYIKDEDNVIGTNMGFAGLFVNRTYGQGPQNAKVEIIGDSPMMAGLNAMLAMPAMLTSGDPNQKRIKVDGYKSIMNIDKDEAGNTSYSVQIPVNSTLITFTCDGYSETQVMGMLNTIPISHIARLAN